MSTTSIECLRGRHHACFDRACACSVCGHGRVMAGDLKVLPPPRAERKPRPVRAPRPKVKKVKKVRANALPAEVVAEIETGLRAGSSISEVARSQGISRDRVRTIKLGLQAQGEVLPTATSATRWRVEYAQLRTENEALQAKVHELQNTIDKLVDRHET